jgi:gamma-glutamylputrescine oxidase
MTQSCWQHKPGAPLSTEVDVAIVGGGIAGLSLAYWLTELAPQLKVCILEAETIGHGASGRNAGFNTVGSTSYLANLVNKEGLNEAKRYWDFKQLSLRLMREHLFNRFAVEQNFWGSTTVYRNQNLLEEHLEVLRSLQAEHLKVVSREELASQQLKGLVGGLSFTHEGCLHSMKLLLAMKEYIESKGVKVYSHQAVSWGDDLGDKIKLICNRGSVKASKVLLAINGYAGQFHADLKSWVQPKRAQMLTLDFSRKKLTGNFYDPPHKVYFRQDPSTGDLLVGGMRLLEEESENSDFDKTTPIIQEALAKYAEDIFQTKLEVKARWSGVMGFTPEERPYIKPVSFLKHTTFVGGFSGHGMGLAFGVAFEAVQRLIGQSKEVREVL